ncbi:MAG: prephenate dehydrogenase/arogenate dehydrogenase family protein [Clostridia bacterium]|nr:prephenate dehydrogenase/arogenate dehydrogenase family protein [Clostridia bacterium]
MKIGVVGLGLIGGSVAKAIKTHTTHTVLGADLNGQVVSDAIKTGVADAELLPENLRECEVIFIALYPHATIDFVEKNKTNFGSATVVDCCGVKQIVCDACEVIARENGFVFIGGHPMAGIEKTGFYNSKGDLFEGASMILTPCEDVPEENLDKVSAVCTQMGFGSITVSTPEGHDKTIALTSQLAHVLSSAYVKSPAALLHTGFSAGSFKDMTRVARLNEDMWTELFFDNSSALIEEIDGLVQRLTEYSDALKNNDRAGMHALLAEGHRIKEIVG